MSDINIDSAKLNGNLIDEEDLTKKSSRQFLRGYPKNRENTIKKDTIIRIVGAVSLVVIAALGTFFVNPDDVLLGEIVDLIKSFQ